MGGSNAYVRYSEMKKNITKETNTEIIARKHKQEKQTFSRHWDAHIKR